MKRVAAGWRCEDVAELGIRSVVVPTTRGGEGATGSLAPPETRRPSMDWLVRVSFGLPRSAFAKETPSALDEPWLLSGVLCLDPRAQFQFELSFEAGGFRFGEELIRIDQEAAISTTMGHRAASDQESLNP